MCVQMCIELHKSCQKEKVMMKEMCLPRELRRCDPSFLLCLLPETKKKQKDQQKQKNSDVSSLFVLE